MESEKKSKKRGRKTCHAEHSADLAAQALRCLPVVSAQLSAAQLHQGRIRVGGACCEVPI